MLPILTLVDPTSICRDREEELSRSPRGRTAPHALATRSSSSARFGCPELQPWPRRAVCHRTAPPASTGSPTRPLWTRPGLEFGVPAAGAGTFGSQWQREPGLTACWKSVDMPMLSSTFSKGRFSFSHTSCRRDSSIYREEGRQEDHAPDSHPGSASGSHRSRFPLFLEGAFTRNRRSPHLPPKLVLQHHNSTWRFPVTGCTTDNTPA